LKIQKKWGHSAGPALAHGRGNVGLVHEPFWPAGALGRHVAAHVGWRARRWPGGDRLVTRSYPRAPWGLQGGARQGAGRRGSLEMASGGGAEKRSGAVACQRRRGAPVVVGGSIEVLEHEGEERKVRGMAT
jgi:hypothetical protein